MKSHVAVYKTHDQAFKAVKALSERNFPMEHVSLVGKADIIDDHIKVKNIEIIKLMPLALSIIGGIIFGFLIGYDVIRIPGLNFMDGKGFFFNFFWGAFVGLVIGALLTILIAVLIQKDRILRYKEHLIEKRFLVIVNGTEEEIHLAQKILHTEGQFRAVA